MGNPLMVHHLNGISRFHSLNILGLMEIKNQQRVDKKFLFYCSYSNFYFVNPRDASSGLYMAWSHSIQVNIISFDSYYIHASFLDLKF